jgi:hypothetical protein
LTNEKTDDILVLPQIVQIIQQTNE